MNVKYLFYFLALGFYGEIQANQEVFNDLEKDNYEIGRVVSSDQLTTLESHEADLLEQLAEETNQSQQVILYYMLAEVRRDMADQLRIKNHETYDRHPTYISAASNNQTKNDYRQLASEWDMKVLPQSHAITFQMFQMLNLVLLVLATALGFLFLRKREFHPFFQKRN